MREKKRERETANYQDFVFSFLCFRVVMMMMMVR